ncbi:hypothetical protein ACFSCX_06345 [Bacillus salitolerans]|uniref:Fur-regulated basic protein B n=1 Tax=Bacillus salitolerans TaxID=1437434 RepID=A0ABW4LNT3_9BACI
MKKNRESLFNDKPLTKLPKYNLEDDHMYKLSQQLDSKVKKLKKQMERGS